MVSVGSIIVTSHGLARVVAVQPAHAKGASLTEKSIEAVPLGNSPSGVNSATATGPGGHAADHVVADQADTPAASFTQSYLLSVVPAADSDPTSRARAVKASQHAYDDARHRLKSLQEDEQPQTVNLKT